jgi:hypothetical protein
MKSLCPQLAIGVLGLSVACSNGGGNGGDDTAGGPTGSDDTSAGAAVWDDMSHTPSTADTFYGVYAEGNQVWVAVSGGAVEVLEGGKKWTRYDATSTPPMSQGKISVETEDLRGIWGDGAGTVKAVGDSGKIATWTGAGWQMEDIGTAGLEAIDGASAGNLMIGGWGGIYTNQDGGDWVGPYQLNGNPLMNHLWYNGSVGIAVGANGARATYGGADWALNSDAELRTLYGVHGLSLDDAWAVGEHGISFHYDGNSWEEYDTGTEASLWAVWMITKDSVYAVGNNGTAVHWDGTEWSPLPTGGRANLYGIYGVGENDIWACGASGALFHYSGGASAEKKK